MKTFLWVALLLGAIAGMVYLSHPAPVVIVEPPTPVPTTPPPIAIATPAPTPSPATPVPDPLAPDGVFYLATSASITTDDGIFGLKPGAKLKLTGQDQYSDDQGHKLSLQPDEVTNNLRIAAMIIGGQAAAQAALREEQEQQREAEMKLRDAGSQTTASRGTAVGAVSKTMLDAPAHDQHSDRSRTRRWIDQFGREHISYY